MSASESPVPAIAPEAVPPPPASGSTLLRWVCTSNPFYVISAAMFLFGLRISFGAGNRENDLWALMGGLAGYTLLLTGAALVLVRFARVWNDVRTVLLLVVLMFLATSVTFDELLVLDPARGQWFFIGGFLFAVATTELLLRGIRLRLPLLFRIPYHLTLALFFLYPLVLAPHTQDPHSELLMWGLWGFAPAAGLVLLTLIPAIRRGRNYLRDNGSPWPWPYYPWSVFVFLAAAVCGRAFLLCWSFHLLPSPTDQLIFGPYFLAPFGFAVAVLVLELGLIERSVITRVVALAIPAGLVVLSAIGHRSDPIYADFLRHFMSRVGASPLFLTLVAVGGYYLYAWARGVSSAADCFTAVPMVLAFVKPDAVTLEEVSAPFIPLLMAGVLIQVCVWLARRERWRLVIGGTVGAVWLGTLAWRLYRELREEIAGLDYLVVSLLLLPVAVLISLVKGGAVSRWVQRWFDEAPTPTG